MDPSTTPRVADLHLHTCYSDGTLTPAELVREAHARGLSTIAVTDHDTMESFPEASAEAAALGVELIPGIEVSTQSAREDIHLLGYCMDMEDAAFRTWLTELRTARLQRLERMVERLRQLGMAVTVDDVIKISGPGTVGRLHVARALVACGAVNDTNQAFDKYLGTHKPAYVADCHPSPEEGIRRLRAARGLPVLAHPVYLKDEALITTLAQCGLAGLEVYHAKHDAGQQMKYAQIAQREQLLMTGGSDCHGTAKGQMMIGTVKLPYTYVEQLKACHAQTYAA